MNEGEKKVVSKMITIYCKGNHHTKGKLCAQCGELNSYAMMRLERCPFKENKPACDACTIHCYKKDMRGQIKLVMRYAGPRMLFRHPLSTLQHFSRELKRRRLNPVPERTCNNNR